MRTTLITLLASLAGTLAEDSGAYILRNFVGDNLYLSPDGEPKEGTPVTL